MLSEHDPSLQASDPIPFVAGVIHWACAFTFPVEIIRTLSLTFADLCSSILITASSFPTCTSHSRFLISTAFFDSTSPFIYARRCCRQSCAIVEVEGIIANECNSFAPAMILSRHRHILGSEVHGSPAFPGWPSDPLLPFLVSAGSNISAGCLSERSKSAIPWRSVSLLFFCACGDANACNSGSNEP